jgi:hypothetical protein
VRGRESGLGARVNGMKLVLGWVRGEGWDAKVWGIVPSVRDGISGSWIGVGVVGW